LILPLLLPPDLARTLYGRILNPMRFDAAPFLLILCSSLVVCLASGLWRIMRPRRQGNAPTVPTAQTWAG
jgi:hypothetical protein